MAWYQDVFDIIFPDVDRVAANKPRLASRDKKDSKSDEDEE